MKEKASCFLRWETHTLVCTCVHVHACVCGCCRELLSAQEWGACLGSVRSCVKAGVCEFEGVSRKAVLLQERSCICACDVGALGWVCIFGCLLGCIRMCRVDVGGKALWGFVEWG